jgi:corrinoid protein of di/trimethylamine methyltransferase
MASEKELLDRLSEIVVKGNIVEAKSVAEAALAFGIEPWKAISNGLTQGMKIVGEKFAKKEYYLPEMLLSAKAMQEALGVLLPMVKPGSQKSAGKIVIGTVEGDIHDIGKNIVKALLIAAGYEVIDLGKDVPTEEFVRKAQEVGAQVIGMSTLMTPTLESIERVEQELREKGMKNHVKTIVGGASVSQDFARKVGSDAYGKDAVEGVNKIKLLVDTIVAAVEQAKKRS